MMADEQIPPPPDSETRPSPPTKPPPTERALIDAFVKLARGEWGATPESWKGLDTEIGRTGITLGELGKRQSGSLMSAAAERLSYDDVAGIAFLILLSLIVPDVVGDRFEIANRVLKDEAEKGGTYAAAAQGEGALEKLQKQLYAELQNVVRLFVPYVGFLPKHPPGAADKKIPEAELKTRRDVAQLYTRPRNAALFIGKEDGEMVGVDLVSLTGAQVPETDGMLALDAAIASHIEKIGDAGKEYAKLIRENATKRLENYRVDGNAKDLWSKWLVENGSVAPVHYINLAKVLWDDVVGPRLDQDRRKPPALVRPVYVDTLVFHGQHWTKDVEAKNVKSLSFAGREIARAIGASFDSEVILRGLSLLGSVTAHRLFRWEVLTGHEQHMSGFPNPSFLEIPGGWSGLATMLKMKPEKHAGDLRALVQAQAHYSFTFPDGSRGNMLSYNERPARGHQPALVTISLGPALMPQYMHSLRGPGNRKLVPLLRQLPPLHGRANEHGHQLTMALSVVAEMRERARELAREGSVKLTLDDFARMADRSGLPRQLIVPVRKIWLDGSSAAPPFLLETSADHYTLADTHAAERDFIIEGGRKENQGAVAGARSVRDREAKLNRLENARRAKKHKRESDT